MLVKSLRGIIPIAALLLLWQLLGSPELGTTPPPSTWGPALVEIERNGVLWPALGRTLTLFVTGLSLAIVIGVVVGTALGSSRTLLRALGPTLEFLRATPAATIVPLAILLFGAGSGTETGIVVFGCIWPILLNTTAGRAAVPEIRLEVARTLSLSWFDRMRKVIMPTLLPDVVVGIGIAAPLALVCTLLVDFLAGTGGVGGLLIRFEQAFQSQPMFALLCVIGVIGVAISLSVSALSRLVLRRFPAGTPVE